MSHFTVLVIGDNVEEQLAPFQENNMGDCPGEYLTFTDQEDEFLEEYLEGSSEEFYDSSSSSWGMQISKEQSDLLKSKKVGDVVILTKSRGNLLDGYFGKGNRYKCGAIQIEHKAPSEYIWILVQEIIRTKGHDPDVCFDGDVEALIIDEPKELLNKEKYATFEIFCADQHGHDSRDTQMNRYGYWSNTDKFDENGILTSGSKWDWYEIGGRFTGFFRLKSQISDDPEDGIESFPEHKVGNPGLMTKPAKIGYADQARKCDIDFEAIREEKRQRASERYDMFEKFFAMHEQPRNWKDLIADVDNGKIAGIENAREIYWNQPRQVQKKKLGNIKMLSEEERSFITWIEFDDYNVPRNVYIDNAGFSAIQTFAVIKDGKWYERGNMGWWGCVSDEKSDEQWKTQFDELLNSLSDDTLLTVIDAHI